MTDDRHRGGAARGVLLLIAALVVAAAAPRTAHADARDGVRAWYQFDWRTPLAPEVVGPFLVNGTGAGDATEPAPAWSGLEDGFGAALLVAANGGGVRILGSESGTHWSNANALIVNAWVLARIELLPADAAPRTLAGRWSSPETGQWRLATDPATGGLVLEVRTASSVARAVVPAVPFAETLGARVAIDPTAEPPTASLDVRRGDGSSVGSASVVLDGAPAVSLDACDLGSPPVADATVVRLDAFAAWNRMLDEAEWAELAGPDGFARWATVDGWSGPGAIGYRTERVDGVLFGHVRHVLIGDSFAYAAAWNRVLPAFVRVSRLEPYVAAAGGVRPFHAFVRSAVPYVDDGPEPNPRAIDRSTLYECEFENGDTPRDYYGMPVNQLMELRGHPGVVMPEDGRLVDLRMLMGSFDDMATDPLGAPGDSVLWRVIHRPLSTAAPLESMRLLAGRPGEDGEEAIVDLTAGTPRQASWSGAEVLGTVANDDVAYATLLEPTPGAFTAPGERLANLVTMVLTRTELDDAGVPTKTPMQGQYISTLNDIGWSMRDFGDGYEVDGDDPKAYSAEQIGHWLEATTLDPAQPMVFWWYVDMEPLSPATVAQQVRDFIDLADAGCALAGLPRARHVLIVPHLHKRSELTEDQLLLAFEDFRRGFDLVVDDPDYDHVCRISIYDATDGVYFDDRPQANAWLAARGYDAFRYGDPDAGPVADLTAAPLLDNADFHPARFDSAAFFASFIGPEIAAGAPCIEDVNGDFVVDFSDLVLVLADWGPCDGCIGDVDGDGVVGFTDLLFVIARWGNC